MIAEFGGVDITVLQWNISLSKNNNVVPGSYLYLYNMVNKNIIIVASGKYCIRHTVLIFCAVNFSKHLVDN